MSESHLPAYSGVRAHRRILHDVDGGTKGRRTDGFSYSAIECILYTPAHEPAISGPDDTDGRQHGRCGGASSDQKESVERPRDPDDGEPSDGTEFDIAIPDVSLRMACDAGDMARGAQSVWPIAAGTPSDEPSMRIPNSTDGDDVFSSTRPNEENPVDKSDSAIPKRQTAIREVPVAMGRCLVRVRATGPSGRAALPPEIADLRG